MHKNGALIVIGAAERTDIIRAVRSDSFVIVRHPFVTLHEDDFRGIWAHSPNESLQACTAHVLSVHIAKANYLEFLSSENI